MINLTILEIPIMGMPPAAFLCAYLIIFISHLAFIKYYFKVNRIVELLEKLEENTSKESKKSKNNDKEKSFEQIFGKKEKED